MGISDVDQLINLQLQLECSGMLENQDSLVHFIYLFIIYLLRGLSIQFTFDSQY